ncbi:MAG: hypothetical protein LIR46_02865 [Bacteroidota bacterium]|nr:hypothetical protein [Bacteroidota bacterium]
MMEINTEINRVFGEEMAKIFASSISEKEIKEKAEDAWRKLNSNVNEWGHSKNSDIESYIKNVLLQRLQDKIYEILKEPVKDEYLETKARELVEKAKTVAEEAIVKSIANSIATRTLSVWNSHDKFVSDVLNVLHTKDSEFHGL